MELIKYILEKSNDIGLTMLLCIISLFATWYVRYQDAIPLDPHDLLAGTLSMPSHFIVKGLWIFTAFTFVLYLFRRFLVKFF